MAQKSASFEPKSEAKDNKEPILINDEQSPKEIAKRNIAKLSPTKAVKAELESKPSLFANIASQTPYSSVLFNNPVNSASKVSMFGNSSSLFSSSVFSNTSGLFNNASEGGLFNNASTGLFGGKSVAQIVPTKAPSVGLFSINFSNANAANADEDGEEDEEDGVANSSEDEHKEIVMKHEYKKTTTQLIKFPLIKFRKNQNDVLEKGSVAIEETIEQKNHILVYRNAINFCLYQGYLVKGVSTVANLNNKKENIVIKLVSLKDKESIEYNKDTVKLMFTNPEDGEKFIELAQSLCVKEKSQEDEQSKE